MGVEAAARACAASCCTFEPVSVRMANQNGHVTIAVADCGDGMDAEFVRTRLFQPFASTKKGGFGVGAFEAKSLVSAMGGRLTVESKPGEGSLFTIILPAAEAAPEFQRKFA